MLSTQEQENLRQEFLAEYISGLFKDGNEPFATTLICPECGCDWVSITGIRTNLDFDSKDDAEKENTVTVKFRGACKHNWEIIFGSINEQVYMSDDHYCP